jgi:hypothetical protein
MKKLFYLTITTMIFCTGALAQLTLPRESAKQEISQTIGDTRIAVVYHRPNVKGRPIWGCETADVVPKGGVTYPCLVPSGQVWRVGANENTTFEVTNDVKINGQPLPAGKYGLHAIPNKDEWIIIFNKVNNEWGSFKYDAKQDQLRVTVKPAVANDAQETMSIGFENNKLTSTEAVIRWEKLRVTVTIDVGDVNGRVLQDIRKQIAAAKADDFRTPAQGAGWVWSNKMTANYDEAIGWLDKSIAIRENFGTLSAKAQILAATGKTAEAIAVGEKAVQVGKAATPAANTDALEKMLTEWKAKK